MIRFLTAGESHGPMLSAILEGIPAGLSLTQKTIQKDLQRRQKGFGASPRMSLEKDRVQIISGVIQGKTTGGPIGLIIKNRDSQIEQKPPMTIPRPGHADLTGAIKYGYKDLRLSLERSSARETAMRVAIGAVCKAFLNFFGILVGGYVVQIGSAGIKKDTPMDFIKKIEKAEKSQIRCPFPEEKAMLGEIQKAIEQEDTVGGIFEVVAINVPPGLGSFMQYDRRLDAQIASLFMSIPAIKGVEFAFAFENATKKGSEVQDEIFASENKRIIRKTNRAGGLEGGITTGEPVVVRAAMKPISTIKKGMQSVDLTTGKPCLSVYQRSDVCAVPRAVVVGESMLSFAIANALIEKIGGDSMEEMLPRFHSLKDRKL